MHQTRIIKILFIVLVLILLVFGFYFRNDLVVLFWRLAGNISEIQNKLPQDFIEEIKTEVIAPPPLRAIKELSVPTTLTKAGVIAWTNSQRVANGGLAALKENSMLDAAALAKVKDMFAFQYFEHESPSGAGPDKLAEDVSYDYILIGENLALGNYGNDKALVQAWMDSPGHRANILNENFREIGVAVMKGNFEGHTTWLAVQEFGLPLSVCEQPNTALKAQVDSNEKQFKVLSQSIEAARFELDSFSRHDPNYAQKVDQYNTVVNEYNLLISQTKTIVQQYNNQVNAFNECANSF
jgi:uncharacterized protein YkwD